MADKPLAHSYSSLKQFDNCPKQYYMQRITKEVEATFGDASLMGSRQHKHLEQRLRDKALLPVESAKYEPLCVALENLPGHLFAEQEMTLNAKLTPVGWWGKDAWLRSKIDVLVLDGQEAIVADWKTGKHRPDFTQLEMFAMQTFKHYPDVQRVKSVFVWLKDKKMDSQTYDRMEAPELWNKLLGRVHRIEQALEAENWPAKPSGLCPWCPAKHLCEFANV